MGALLALPSTGWAHAFPDHAQPRVGQNVETGPPTVRIWFDGPIEPVFSTIRVEDDAHRRIDRGDGHVDARDATLLEASVPPLGPGTYYVFWSVVGRDGHRTEGNFHFHVKRAR